MFQDYKNLLNNTVITDCLISARSKKYLFELLEPELLSELTIDINLQCKTCSQDLPKPYFQELSANFIVESIRLHPNDLRPEDALNIFNARYFIQNEEIISKIINVDKDYYVVTGSHLNNLLFEQIRTDLSLHDKIDIFLFENKASKAYKKIVIGSQLTCKCSKTISDYYIDNLDRISEIYYNKLSLNFKTTHMSDSEILNIMISQYSKNSIQGVRFSKQPEVILLESVELKKGFNFLVGELSQSFLDLLHIKNIKTKINLAQFLKCENKLAKALASTLNAKLIGLKPNDFIRLNSSLYCNNCAGRKCEDCDYTGLTYLADEFKILNISYKEFTRRKIKDNLNILRVLGVDLENKDIDNSVFELKSDFFNYHNQVNSLWIESIGLNQQVTAFMATDISELLLSEEQFRGKIVLILNTKSFNIADENCIYVKRELDLGYKFYKYEKKQ